MLYLYNNTFYLDIRYRENIENIALPIRNEQSYVQNK